MAGDAAPNAGNKSRISSESSWRVSTVTAVPSGGVSLPARKSYASYRQPPLSASPPLPCPEPLRNQRSYCTPLTRTQAETLPFTPGHRSTHVYLANRRTHRANPAWPVERTGALARAQRLVRTVEIINAKKLHSGVARRAATPPKARGGVTVTSSHRRDVTAAPSAAPESIEVVSRRAGRPAAHG